jgi:hypothetical protein
MAILAKHPRIATLMECQVTELKTTFSCPWRRLFWLRASCLISFFRPRNFTSDPFWLDQFCWCHRFVTRKFHPYQFFVEKCRPVKKFPFDPVSIHG